MMSREHESPFLRRFDVLWARLRKVQFGQAFSLTGLIAVAGVTLLIAFDYWFELDWGFRAAGTIIIAGVALSWLVLAARAVMKAGTRPSTAAEIEKAFPLLGQSVRTTVQFGEASADEVAASGVRTALVEALEEDTHTRSRPLHLDAVIPTRRLWATLGGAIAAAVVLLGAAGLNWEWRTASARALLADTPYTELKVEPGNIKVDLGQPVEIALVVTGRTGRTTKLFTRPTGDASAEWTEREFSTRDAASAGVRAVKYVAKIDAVKKPLEYRAVAGPAASGTYRVDVRYPLAVKKVEVELTPPAYTGHPPATTEDTNLTAVEGTVAKFAITLDQEPRTASLVLTDLGRRSEDEPAPQPRTLPLEINGSTLTASLPLTSDLKYSIHAETTDGLRLPENSHRIRVRSDQSPEVYFEEPRDPIDVHTLAEILMRVRVRDDFGLTKAGIVFEVNNEEEYPLLTQDFETAAEELRKLGKLMPDTQAALEKVLPLEFFQLSQKDSVAYYAFAEDNYPDTPHRTVTDLRFVDIRPFRIQYKVLDLPPGQPSNPGPKIASLEEIINRQRFNLNRSMGVSRKFERSEKIDLNTVDSINQSETDIAKATRELADFLGNFMNDDLNDEIQLLLQAEANMLAAVDSLSAGKYENAVLQERDALKELIEGRNRLLETIMKNPEKFRSLSAADRRIAQKLRKPKSDKEEAEEVVRRLKQLAMQESEVQSGLMPSSSSSGSGESQESADEASKKDADPKESAKKNEPNEEKPKDDEPSDPKENADAAKSDRPSANESQEGSGKSGTRLSARAREELKTKQLDVNLESQDVEKSLGKLKGITDLAKERMAAATKTTESASGSIERGDNKKAAEEAGSASEMFNELAQQVEALIAKEAADRLAAAQKLAGQLAEAQQEVADQTPMSGSSSSKSDMPPEQPMPSKSGKGQPTDDPKSDPSGAGKDDKDDKPEADPKKPENKDGQSAEKGDDKKNDPANGKGSSDDKKMDDRKMDGKARADALAKQAERNTETGKTVLDLLNSVLKSTDPADKDVIAKVEELMRENKLDETVKRMSALPDQLRDGRLGDARVNAADNADRWEAAANRLAVAVRQITAPKLEELLLAEQRLQELRERLDKLGSEREVVQWLADAGKLMEQLERLKISDKLREQLRELMKEAGWTEEAQRFRLRGGGWVLTDRAVYDAPAGYLEVVRDLTEDVQAHIQELILGDLLSGKDDLVPPQYEQLVERYYKILATASKKQFPNRKMPEGRP